MKDEQVFYGLSCGEVLSRLDAFFDGSIDEETGRRVVGHVTACARCEQFGGTYADMVRAIRYAARPPDPAPEVLSRLREKLGALGG